MPDDYLAEADLIALGIGPILVRIICPHATELRALDGTCCWAVVDLAPLLEGTGDE